MGMVGHFTANGTTNIPVTTAASNLDFEWYVNGNDLIITTSFPKLTHQVKLLTLNGQVLKGFKQAALNQTISYPSILVMFQKEYIWLK